MKLRLLKLYAQFKQLIRFAPVKSDLHYLLSLSPEPTTLEEKIAWLQKLIEWIRFPLAPSNEKFRTTHRSEINSVRLRFVLQLLSRNSEWKANVDERVKAILLQSSSVELFAETGLMKESGFLSEATNRVFMRLIPRPRSAESLADVLARVFPAESDADWVLSLANDEELAAEVFALFRSTTSASRDPMRKAMTEAVLILSSQVSAIGTSAVVRERLPARQIFESPFLQLNHALQSQFLHEASSDSDFAEFAAQIARCRLYVEKVFEHLEQTGVSVSLVYRLEDLIESIDRIELLLKMLEREIGSVEPVLRVLSMLIRGELASRSLSELLRTNTHMVARKVVERTGHSGEHYISQSRHEYNVMLLSAAGGGLLTVGTAIMKVVITGLKLPFFFEGLFSAVNYAGSFVLMQFCGFTLATKQPSMTASALAANLKDVHTRADAERFVDEFQKVARSQAAAAFGNLGMVAPGAVLIDWLYKMSSGSHLLNPSYAIKAIEMLSPWASLTIPLAALTGVILWISSITAGWIENWIVFRRIPEAMAENRRLREVFGVMAAERTANWFLKNVAGLAGNISLGFLLAFTPIFGRFFGLPLDVRHVTLSTGTLALAVCSIGLERMTPLMWVSSVLGIIVIGLLNFGVSFAMALWVACRARNVRRVWVMIFLRAAGARFLRKPLSFLFFPRQTP